VLQVSPSGYYAWRGRPLITPQVRANAALRRRLCVVHAASHGTYGSPRLQRALRAEGTRVGRNRIIRLMRVDHLEGRPRKRFRVTTTPDPTAVARPNILQRRFAVPAPNRAWAADITAVSTREGWLYVAVVLDLYSRRVVGWAVRPTLASDVALAALQLALGRRVPPPGLLHHSDRGTQYTSVVYQRLLQQHGLRCSRSRPGNCYDNAPVESFFHTLKNEIGERSWPSRRAATQALAEYIERFYNRERLHSTLNYRSPARFEADTVAV
jgi:transposase InsO family protein